MSTNAIVNLLGGPRVIGDVGSLIEMAQAVRRGLPWAALESMGSALSMSLADLAVVLHIRSRTLSRRKAAGRLEAMESDRLFRLARIFVHAVEVFESEERARDWLDTDNRALGGRKPRQLLDTDVGAQEVDGVLGRIEHGIFG
ncbi:MAG: DUF2384 domain-containing protein [bacterium]|nr:DUF2384 domain-containing protein [bacterium]